jgi:hypothetical protein
MRRKQLLHVLLDLLLAQTLAATVGCVQNGHASLLAPISTTSIRG